MPEPVTASATSEKRSLTAYAVPVGVVAIVLLLVVPIPAPLLDMLFALNITGSLVVLLTSMYVRRPLDFAIFPPLLLVFTLFRLGLNVASTRLVLGDGYAGKVIDAFGHFVISGSLVIGLVVFLILVVIQFVVITNGAARVAEVGARFTLDAMPGKQMAIDADLNAGLINEHEARQRRSDVSAEADFYGAMDGASKFVKGDAIAGIVITLINLIGGFIIGMVQKGKSPMEALETYSLLTVGDGLVTQIPALLMSVATGLVVTRSTTQGDLGSDAIAQLGQNRQALFIAGGAAIALALVPGMPKLPFVLVGATLILVAQRIKALQAKAEPVPDPTPALPAKDSTASLVNDMRVDPLEITLAPDLVDLVDSQGGSDLLSRVRALRRKVAMDLGLVVPPVRTRDCMDLPSATYAIKISGVEVSRGTAPVGQVLALGENLDELPGTPTTEPVFGLAARWVPIAAQRQAELLGATVVDRSSVVVTHLAEVVRSNAARLLGREDVRILVDAVKDEHPALVDELMPAVLSLGEVQRVLQALLEESVCIRDLPRIFEGMSQRAKVATDQDGLVESARAALGPAVAAQYAQDGRLRVLTIDPALEQEMADAARPSETGLVLALDPERTETILGELGRLVAAAEECGYSVVLTVAPGLRSALRRLVAFTVPRLPVLSYQEVGSSQLPVEAVGMVRGTDALVA